MFSPNLAPKAFVKNKIMVLQPLSELLQASHASRNSASCCDRDKLASIVQMCSAEIITPSFVTQHDAHVFISEAHNYQVTKHLNLLQGGTQRQGQNVEVDTFTEAC